MVAILGNTRRHFLSLRYKLGIVVFLSAAILGSISNKLVMCIKFLKPVQFVRQFFLNYSKSSRIAFKVGEITSFTDAFVEKINQTTNPDSMFYGHVGDENLAASVAELVIAGSKSSNMSLQSILLFLAAHPDKQSKVHLEIDTILDGRLPSFQDKTRMPYLSAVMMETWRILTIFPFGAPRKPSHDVDLQGYKIKKGSIIMFNFMALHNDPTIWGDPHIFRPERFLSPDGSCVVKHDTFLPFGTGKRSCPGEYLAKHNLFIFLVVILQRFAVSVPAGLPMNLNSKGLGVVLTIPEHKLVFNQRDLTSMST